MLRGKSHVTEAVTFVAAGKIGGGVWRGPPNTCHPIG
jgi:hypothetical protein